MAGHDPTSLKDFTLSISSVPSGNQNADRIARGVLLLVMVLICGITWEKWGNLSIDCGREMYIPAAISQGKRLYFDLWYPYGPLIPYWNAFLFRIFGIHLWVLYSTGIAIVTIITFTLYSLSRTFLPTWLSFTAGFAFLVRAFHHDIFNYVLPYSYPAAYSAMFSTVLLWLLVQDCFEERGWRIWAAGWIACLTLLTKIEFGLSAYGFIACAIAIRAARARSAGKIVRDAIACAPGLLLCAGIYGLLVLKSSISFMFEENIPLSPNSYFVSVFAKRWLHQVGFTTDPNTLIISLYICLSFAGALLVALWFASLARVTRRLLFALALGICGMHIVLLMAGKVSGVAVPRIVTVIAPGLFFNPGLLWLAVVLFVVSMKDWWHTGRSSQDSAVSMLAISTLAFGARVLTAMFPEGYSVFYGTTAYLAWLVTLYTLSRYLPVRPPEKVWRGFGIVLCCGLLAIMGLNFTGNRRTFLIHSTRGSIYTDQSTGEGYSKVLAFLDSVKPRSEPFVTMPEDTSLYYFSATLAPSRWYVLTPGVLPPGELTSKYLEELDRARVKYVILSNRATPEYGAPIFGADYNRPIYRWLEQNFRVIAKIGAYERVPFPDQWGALIYERKSGETSGALEAIGGAEPLVQ
jgi:hypothetical protein